MLCISDLKCKNIWKDNSDVPGIFYPPCVNGSRRTGRRWLSKIRADEGSPYLEHQIHHSGGLGECVHSKCECMRNCMSWDSPETTNACDVYDKVTYNAEQEACTNWRRYCESKLIGITRDNATMGPLNNALLTMRHFNQNKRNLENTVHKYTVQPPSCITVSRSRLDPGFSLGINSQSGRTLINPYRLIKSYCCLIR
jgi:hypothetical protein